jgi:acyl dehydratase
MAKSEAAKEVKLGFFVAAGFWVFIIVIGIIMAFAVKALR